MMSCVVSIKYIRVTDRQTDTAPQHISRWHVRGAVKMCMINSVAMAHNFDVQVEKLHIVHLSSIEF